MCICEPLRDQKAAPGAEVTGGRELLGVGAVSLDLVLWKSGKCCTLNLLAIL